MNIHPIKNQADYDKALNEADALWGAEEGTEKGDHLDVLLVLIENYEAKHYPIDPPDPIEAITDPIEAIKFRMEQMSLSRKDMERFIGSRGRVSEVLNRRRSLSLPMIRKLHRSLHIPLESLIFGTTV